MRAAFLGEQQWELDSKQWDLRWFWAHPWLSFPWWLKDTSCAVEELSHAVPRFPGRRWEEAAAVCDRTETPLCPGTLLPPPSLLRIELPVIRAWSPGHHAGHLQPTNTSVPWPPREEDEGPNGLAGELNPEAMHVMARARKEGPHGTTRPFPIWVKFTQAS